MDNSHQRYALIQPTLEHKIFDIRELVSIQGNRIGIRRVNDFEDEVAYISKKKLIAIIEESDLKKFNEFNERAKKLLTQYKVDFDSLKKELNHLVSIEAE